MFYSESALLISTMKRARTVSCHLDQLSSGSVGQTVAACDSKMFKLVTLRPSIMTRHDLFEDFASKSSFSSESATFSIRKSLSFSASTAPMQYSQSASFNNVFDEAKSGGASTDDEETVGSDDESVDSGSRGSGRGFMTLNNKNGANPKRTSYAVKFSLSRQRARETHRNNTSGNNTDCGSHSESDSDGSPLFNIRKSLDPCTIFLEEDRDQSPASSKSAVMIHQYIQDIQDIKGGIQGQSEGDFF